jgi:hypothetical protein
MNWLKWILAYLFDCVHLHTTWPHRDRTGFAYICCLDCGRELPYSLERMRIVTRGAFGRSTLGGSFGEWNCRAGHNNVIIRTDGTVAPCFPIYSASVD